MSVSLLSPLFSVRERMPGIFFFFLVFFTTISVLHIWTRLLASEVKRETQRKGSIDGNEENSCVNKIDR